tara:strand:- start:213 stop:314 length:102 start_codon:yes stop_codon:yes gene_type:complete
MKNYWQTSSTGYIPKWTTFTSFGKAEISYTLKK